MNRKPLFNLNSQGELYKLLTDAFRALERGAASIIARGREVARRVNGKGRMYYDIPAYLEATFRVYQPDDEGRSTVMIIVKDLYARTGERSGKPLYDNPTLWGQCKRNQSKGISLYFFNDRTEREVLQEIKGAGLPAAVVATAGKTSMKAKTSATARSAFSELFPEEPKPPARSS